MASTPALPTGTVTFLFTDIEGSTRLLQELGDEWGNVLEDQRRLMRAAITANQGIELGTEGDSFFVVFTSAAAAVQSVVSAQQALAAHAWSGGKPVRVRMGLHTGEGRLVANGYVGLDVHRAARIAACGHGGQVVISDSVNALVETLLPAGVSIRDLGPHRLKDLPRPEQLYQLDIDGLPAEFPPLKTLDVRKNNLPLQLTSFLGRAAELKELKELLAGGRLLTLVGTGGIGKTRLAIELATEVLEDYAHVWLAELAPVSEPGLVAQTLMTAIDVREQAGRSATEALIDYFGSKSALVLLDNCEHLVEACATLAESLLQACPKVKVIATSREELGVAGEIPWRVPTLPVPDPDRLPALDEVAASTAVALFVDRARSASPSFQLTGQNAPLVVQVCQRLDGIPLAIELAASRLSLLSLPQMLTRLNDRFRLLTGGRRTALPRQQTLRAAIDWSHEMLAEPERTLLRRVSVFSGGFTLDLAEEICAWPALDAADILDLLGTLVSKSLVVYEEAGPRYRLLETIREYAAERARVSVEDVELQKRHRARFLALAEEADRELHGPTQLQWFELIGNEIANFRAAFESCLANDDATAALLIATGLGLFWRARGHFSEGRLWLERALGRKQAVPATLRAKGLAWASYLGIWQGAWTQAQIHGEESLNLYTAAHDDWGIGFALQTLGAVALNQDNYPDAGRLEQESVQYLRQAGDTDSLGLSYLYLGVVALRKAEYVAAMRLLEQALINFREVGDMRRVSIALRIMGEVELSQGHYTPATTLLDESLSLVRESRDRVDLGLTLYLLGQAARSAADYPRAKALFEESLALAKEFNDGMSAGLALCELAIVARQTGDLDGATALLEEAMTTFDPREKFGLVACLHGTAMVASQRADTQRAATLFGAAHRIREELGAPIPPFERDEYDQVALGVQAALGDDEFAQLLAEGRSLTIDAAISYAREKPPSPAGGIPGGGSTSPSYLADKSPSPSVAGRADKSPSPSGGGQGGGS
jgi:predicted ATPase/class 3 adenylate cyclase